jgi:hypothetical protein
LFRGFPDLRIHIDKLRHADDAVIVEGEKVFFDFATLLRQLGKLD